MPAVIALPLKLLDRGNKQDYTLIVIERETGLRCITPVQPGYIKGLLHSLNLRTIIQNRLLSGAI
jgi:hypothetical protein